MPYNIFVLSTSVSRSCCYRNLSRTSAVKAGDTDLVHIDGAHSSLFHPITEVNEILVRSLSLFGHQAVTAKGQE